MQDINVSDDLR
jgi:hypothetical protein